LSGIGKSESGTCYAADDQHSLTNRLAL